jgi:hypothetical protein
LCSVCLESFREKGEGEGSEALIAFVMFALGCAGKVHVKLLTRRLQLSCLSEMQPSRRAGSAGASEVIVLTAKRCQCQREHTTISQAVGHCLLGAAVRDHAILYAACPIESPSLFAGSFAEPLTKGGVFPPFKDYPISWKWKKNLQLKSGQVAL